MSEIALKHRDLGSYCVQTPRMRDITHSRKDASTARDKLRSKMRTNESIGARNEHSLIFVPCALISF